MLRETWEQRNFLDNIKYFRSIIQLLPAAQRPPSAHSAPHGPYSREQLAESPLTTNRRLFLAKALRICRAA